MKKWILVLAVAGAAGGGWWYVNKDKQDVPEYITAMVERADLTKSVTVTGSVQSVNEVALSAKTAGQVDEIKQQVGDSVRKGEIVLTLDDTAQRTAVAQARAQVKQAEAALRLTKTGASAESIAVAAQAVSNAQKSHEEALKQLDAVAESAAAASAQAETQIALAESAVARATASLAAAEANASATGTRSSTSVTDAMNSASTAFSNGWRVSQDALVEVNALIKEDSAVTGFRRYAIPFEGRNKVTLSRVREAYRQYSITLTAFLQATDSDVRWDDLSFEQVQGLLTQMEAVLNQGQTLISMSVNLAADTRATAVLPQSSIDAVLVQARTVETSVRAGITQIQSARQGITAAAQQGTMSGAAQDQQIIAAQNQAAAAESELQRVRQAAVQTTAQNQQAITQAESAVSAQDNAILSAQRQLAQVEAGPRTEEVAAQKAAVDAAKAALASVDVRLDDYTIKSPISGTVTELKPKLGEYVGPGVPVVRIIGKGLELIANVSETDIAEVTVGQTTQITLDAFDEDREWSGTVTAIDPAPTVIAGVIYYQVTFALDAATDDIKPGMTANIEIIQAMAQGTLVIEAPAVKEGDDGQPQVRVVGADGFAITRDIETGLQTPTLIEVKNGLAEGAEVVLYEEESS